MQYLHDNTRPCDRCGVRPNPTKGEDVTVVAVYETDPTLLADPVSGRDEVIWLCGCCLSCAHCDLTEREEFEGLTYEERTRSEDLSKAALFAHERSFWGRDEDA